MLSKILLFVYIVTMPVAMSSEIIKKFYIQDASMGEIVDLLNESIKKYGITSVKSITTDVGKIGDKEIVCKEMNYKDIPFDVLVNAICGKRYYPQYSEDKSTIKIREIQFNYYYVFANCTFVKKHALGNQNFVFSDKNNFKSMLIKHAVISNDDYFEIIQISNDFAAINMADYKVRLLENIIYLYENDFEVMKPNTK